jgi:hypothetical protein
VSLTVGARVLISVQSFPYPVDSSSNSLVAQFEWPSGIVLPALCSIMQSRTSQYLGQINVQDIDLAVNTPTGSLVAESNAVILRVYHRTIQNINVKFTGFSFVDPSDPKVTSISVTNGFTGIDSVKLPMSAPSVVTLMISNIPAMLTSPIVALDTLSSQVLLQGSSTDVQGNTQLTLQLQVYPSGLATTKYGFVSFSALAPTCSPSCCANSICKRSCTGKLACFSLQVYDDSLPSIISIFSGLQGPATGGTSILLRVSHFSALAIPGNAVCTFGSNLYLGNVVIDYDGPDYTDVKISTAAYPISGLASVRVPVTLSTISRPDRLVSFSFEYLPSLPTFVSLMPTQGSSMGNVRILLVLANYPFSELSSVLSFGSLLIAAKDLNITHSINGQTAFISFFTPPTLPGNFIISIYPASCPSPCVSTVRCQFVQLNDNLIVIVPPIPSETSFQSDELKFYLAVPESLWKHPSFQVWSSFQMDRWGLTSPTLCRQDFENGVIVVTVLRPQQMLGECNAAIQLSIVAYHSMFQNLTAYVRFYDQHLLRLVSVTPSIVPASTIIASRRILSSSTVAITLVNFPVASQINDTSVVFNIGGSVLISSFVTKVSCVTAIDCINSTVITIKVPASDQVGIIPGTILVEDQSLTFYLNYSAPCPFDSYCGSQRLFPDLLAIIDRSPLTCQPSFCFSLNLVPFPKTLSVVPTRALQTGGTVVTVKLANFPAIRSSDVNVQIGDGATQVSVLPDSVILQAGSTSQQSIATVRFRTPLLLSSVTETNIYVSMQFFSTTRSAYFPFEFIPYLTGKLNVTNFKPGAVSAVSDLNLIVQLTNIQNLPRPFNPSLLQFVYQGNTMSATAVLSSDAAQTVVTLALAGPFTGNEFLQFSVLDTRRGSSSASDPFAVAVIASRDPVLKSYYPTSLVSSEDGTLVRAIVAYIQLYDIDSAVATLSGDVSTDVPTNISAANMLDADNIAFLLSIPAVGPGVLLVALQGRGATVVSFSITVSSKDVPAVTLVSPSSISISSSSQQVSLYLKNFPNPSCGSIGACFPMAIALQVSCSGKLGSVLGHTEQAGILTLTIAPPALRVAGTAACTVRSYDASGRDISTGFQLNYLVVATVSPADGSTQGGALVRITIVGFGLSNISIPSQLSVSFCGAAAVVIDLNFDPISSTIIAGVQVPQKRLAGTCSCSIAVLNPPRSANFLFRYYDPPTATATPSTVAQDGLTVGGKATVSLLLRNFPSVDSVEDVIVNFGGLSCDGAVCQVLGAVNGINSVVVRVTAPACPGCATVVITVTYVGTQLVPDGFDPSGVYIFMAKQATAPFVYFKRVPSVAAVLYCATCGQSSYCLGNGACGDGSAPQQGSAPSGGAGRLTIYVDGARAPAAVGTLTTVAGWSASVVFGGSVPAAVRAMYDVDGSRIAVECELPVSLGGTTAAGVVTLSPPGGTAVGAVYAAQFSLALYSAAKVVICVANSNGTDAATVCRGPAGAAWPLRLLVINLPLRPTGSLANAGRDVQVKL